VKSIDLDLWHIISIGDLQPTKMDFENQYNKLQTKIDKNTKAKLVIYKTLPRVEYERVLFCKTANDIWKCLLNILQEKCKTKDDKLDVAQELVILENLIDKYLVEINTSTTSSNAIIEGINNEEYMSQIRRKSVNKSWSNKDEEDDVNMACEDFQTNVNTSIDGKDYMLQDPSETTNKT
jgi:molybdopterin converting factor small subunit